MTSPIDDLPWPELGNVSRGATRGNQGQKGVLGPPDRDGRCVLQLRVQPGVLAVKLNRTASEWYRTLDNEVNSALKATKTYWRKARRRQDYDARADQDHMELHEWLQQLKDKTMSHLELLMQKGDIQGPPYEMPDDVELSFLRKFIERQTAGLPHNPRLRNGTVLPPDTSYHHLHGTSAGSDSPEPSDHTDYLEPSQPHPMVDRPPAHLMAPSRHSLSPTLSLRNHNHSSDNLLQEASTSKHTLQMARATLARASKDVQDAFMRYTACLESERLAKQSMVAAEKHRDDVMSALLSINQSYHGGASLYRHDNANPDPEMGHQSRHSSASLDEHQRYVEVVDTKPRADPRTVEWPETDPQHVVFPTEPMSHLEDHSGRRKHSRSWEPTQPTMGGLDPHYDYEEMHMPPRKRLHPMMSGYEVMGNPVMQQNMTMS